MVLVAVLGDDGVLCLFHLLPIFLVPSLSELVLAHALHSSSVLLWAEMISARFLLLHARN